MKLIALRGFKNNSKGNVVFDTGHAPTSKEGSDDKGRHPLGVHKGAIFSIGGDAAFDDLSNDLKFLYAQLASAKCIGDGNDPKLVAKVNKECEQEADQREENRRLLAAGSEDHLVTVITKLLVEAGVLKTPKPVQAPA
jgi:hypothetical protein